MFCEKLFLICFEFRFYWLQKDFKYKRVLSLYFSFPPSIFLLLLTDYHEVWYEYMMTFNYFIIQF